MPLASFGNRIPQLSFEVTRAVDDFNQKVRAVCLIPGAGEFVYTSQSVSRKVGLATNVSENVHTRQGGSDWDVALDQLQAILPNVGAVSLIVGWFGDDLRAGTCTIRPGVDAADKVTAPLAWSVAGQSRASAHLVSSVDGRAAYGGTPSDETVVAAIQDLDARGIAVTVAPFIFMDVAAGNALTDPYTGAASQPLYPWRGRITCSPASGQPGSPDKTGAAATQVAAFIGSAAVSDFAIVDEDGRLLRTRRVVLPPLHPALRPPRRRGRRRRRLPHRLGDARPHLGARQRQHLSVRGRARSPRCRRQNRPGFRHQGQLRRRLVRILRPPARRRHRRRPLPPRPAVVLRRHRRRRHRRLLAPLRLARRLEPRRPPGRRALDLRPRLSQRQHPRRRGLRLVLRQLRRPRRADARRPSPTAPTASPGSSASRTSAPGG